MQQGFGRLGGGVGCAYYMQNGKALGQGPCDTAVMSALCFITLA